MLHPFVQAVPSPHDAGVRQVAALSARLAYVLMCATLSWGVLVSTGWVHRLTGRQATRNSHMVLATMTLAIASIHVLSFLFLTDISFAAITLFVPFADGLLRHTAGIIGFELMVAIALSVPVQRFFRYRRWLVLHRLAYPAVALLVVHSLFGAIANGHLEIVWLGGITFLVPTVVLAVLRFIPSRVLAEAGLVKEDA
ncbi:MAG TPA: ferric reductase-like transmembrane domain-containing protein [Pseudonocardiaceae bacterium]|nr:ferric reductase-like transmembrane domain-containing protein [Pseudonocardiaceae bacterium]